MRFGVFVAEFRHFGKDGFGVAFKDSQLEEEGGVEHYIGFFLERVNPLLFSPHDGGATGDGFSRRVVAVFVVADDAPQESDVDGGYPVVVVDIDCGERGDKDFIRRLTRYIG